MATTARSRLTLEEFLELPEQEPGLEFDADGTIHEKMPPNTDHGALQAHLSYLLWAWIKADPTQRAGYVYTELRTNLAGASKLPDVSLYRQRPRASRRKHALEAPDVAIEIVSPRDDMDDTRAKCPWYIEQGSQLALLIDPEQRSVTRFDRQGQQELVSGPVSLLPGLELTVEGVFSVLD
jgi:Uma2 family endonuclease